MSYDYFQIRKLVKSSRVNHFNQMCRSFNLPSPTGNNRITTIKIVFTNFCRGICWMYVNTERLILELLLKLAKNNHRSNIYH